MPDKIPVEVTTTTVTKELDLVELLPHLPEGAEIKHVEHNGQPVINVRLAEWQVAIPVAEDIEQTVNAVVRAAWIHECELEHDLLRNELRDVYKAQLDDLQMWHVQNSEEKIAAKLAAVKPQEKA